MGFGARDSATDAQQDDRRSGPRAQFGIDLETDPDATTVFPRGELDAISAPVFSAVLAALAARGTRFVSIDLSDVRYCNVAALRAMAELAARLHRVDGRVRIVSPGVLDRMLELADLHSLFDLDAALAAGPVRAADPAPLRSTPPVPSRRPRVGHPHRFSTGT
jgi:anti-anti-sigma factor